MAEKLTYYIDNELESTYLDMLPIILNDKEEAENIYTTIADDLPGTLLSNNARKKSFKNLTLANLRYLILGCERAGAEIRVKALATFIYRANTEERLNKLITNKKLIEMMLGENCISLT